MRLTRPVAGSWLRELRENADVLQDEVAVRVGIGAGTLSKLERAEQVPQELAGRIVGATLALRAEGDTRLKATKANPRYVDAT